MRYSRFLALALLLIPATATSASANWTQYKDVQTVTVVTKQPDGSPRETTVWLVVVDGVGYLRTGSTRWGQDLERDPDATLEIEGGSLPVKVSFIEDEPLRQKVSAAFREKYGFTDWTSGLIRFGHTRILRLSDR
jgi:hypothetical protein